MATITAADVNKLRQATGAGMMDCKKALVEADGNFEEAIQNLRKKDKKLPKIVLTVSQLKELLFVSSMPIKLKEQLSL